MIADCLNAAGIGTVVWIDDYFMTPSPEDYREWIDQRLTEARTKGVDLSVLPFLETVDWGLPSAGVEEAVDAVFATLPNPNFATLAEAVSDLTGVAYSKPAVSPDLPPGDFTALRAAFGPALKSYGLHDWRNAGEVVYGHADEKTLFLIDKNFDREDPNYNGLLLLGNLVNQSQGYCVLLTYQCTPAEQQEKRTQFATELKLLPFQFAVLSKQLTGDEDIIVRFSRAIYDAFSQCLTGRLTSSLTNALQQQATETLRALSSQSVYDIDKAVFENSLAEGASELDVLLRILRIKDKRSVVELAKSPVTQRQLIAMRQFRSAMAERQAILRVPETNLTLFREWRKDEVYVDAAMLNALHLPVTCGDLFEVGLEGGAAKTYVLLAQPCDLTLRGDGNRDTEGAVFAVVRQLTAAEALEKDSRSPYRFYDIKDVLPDEAVWRIDFRTTLFVNLAMVDLCALNEDGVARFGRHQPMPPVIRHTGLAKRFEAAMNLYPKKLKGVVMFPHPAIGTGAAALDPTGPTKRTNDYLEYPVKRVGRFEPPVASAILAGWSIFQTRAAFDHDFARKTGPTGPINPPAPGTEAQPIISKPADEPGWKRMFRRVFGR